MHSNDSIRSFRVLTLNNLSARGLERLPRERYSLHTESAAPDAILLRSADLHRREIPESVLVVGRAGGGVNNIPVAMLTARGVPVFNTPGANANAVKELVLGGLLLAARNLCQAACFARALSGDDQAIEEAVEKGKKQFVGFELPGRVLGVIGLGAVGVEVANAARALGMRVLGYDPDLTVRRAWKLSAQVEEASSLEELFAAADVISAHVPLNIRTRQLINAPLIALARKNTVLLNFARADVVDSQAVLSALEEGRLQAYVSDFPIKALKNHPKAITLPHLGASTAEAEENCAIMAADTLREFLENGTVRHSVNYPDAALSRKAHTTRIAIAHRNARSLLEEISTCLVSSGLRIVDLFNGARDDCGYTLIDTDAPARQLMLTRIRDIEGVLSVRVC